MTAGAGVFIVDLHNTLYDEVLEYGGALLAAVDVVLAAAEETGDRFTREAAFAEIASAHRRLGSDWDDDVWFALPSVARLPDPDGVARAAMTKRRDASRERTLRFRYDHAVDAVVRRKAAGETVIVATEATANAAADALRILGLDGVVDAVYSWPYAKPFEALARTPQRTFPSAETDDAAARRLVKPHPIILGRILLDVAQERGLVDADATLDDAFSLSRDATVDLSSLEARLSAAADMAEARAVVDAIALRLEIRPGPHEAALRTLRDASLYVGDSHFKDGFLARSAGVPFVFAAYGKTVAPSVAAEHRRCLDALYRTTGWEPLLIELTQEAGRLEALTDLIEPVATCRMSLAELHGDVG